MRTLPVIVAMALQKPGKLCFVHLDLLQPMVRFEWGKIYKADEEGELAECNFISAVVPGKPYGLRFDGIQHYRSDNQDNLQVGYLTNVTLSDAPSSRHCVIRLDSHSNDTSVEFTFEKWLELIAPG
jgi:hypothetical protein